MRKRNDGQAPQDRTHGHAAPRLNRSEKRRPRSPAPRPRPTLEAMESRELLSTVPVEPISVGLSDSATALVESTTHHAPAAEVMQTCPAVLDLVLLVDGSESFPPAADPEDPASRALALQQLKTFMIDTVNGFSVSPTVTKVSLVQFSGPEDARVEQPLTGSSTQIVSAINNYTPVNGTTDIASGLTLAGLELATRGRPETPGAIVLITDGENNGKVDPNEVATALKAQGIQIFVVGIGDNVDKETLDTWASTPTRTHVFTSTTTAGIAAIQPAFAMALCDSTVLTARLARESDTGASNTDQITRINRPIFIGTGIPGTEVNLFARRAGQVLPTSIGKTTVGSDSRWRFTSPLLADGEYTIIVTGSSLSGAVLTTQVPGIVQIDTVGPRLRNAWLNGGLKVVPQTLDIAGFRLNATFFDDRSGMDAATMRNLSNYQVLQYHFPQPGRLTPTSVVTSFDTTADSNDPPPPPTADAGAIVQFAGARLGGPSLYVFTISEAIRDIAGNPLDGDYRPRFPSGNGVAGGDYSAFQSLNGIGQRRPTQVTAALAKFSRRSNPTLPVR